MSTDYLFSTPSFLSGVARALDLAGQFDRYNESITPEEADSRAIHCDVAAVGEDLRAVMNEPPPAADAEK